MDDQLNAKNFGSNSPASVEDVFANTFILNRLRSIPVDPREILFIKERRFPLDEENKRLLQLLEWERAPMKYVYEWFDEKPTLVNTATATDEEMANAVRELTLALRAVNHIVLYTEHLSDRRLYQLLIHDVLNCDIKYLPNSESPYYWNFCPCTEDSDYENDEEPNDDACLDLDDETDVSCDSVRERVWLTYYATEPQRKRWAEVYKRSLPPKAALPYPRAYLYERVDFH